MKVGIITKPNQKGQIVIPKQFRIALDIKANEPLSLTIRGGGIYVQPIEDIITKAHTESSYVQILKKTQGAWAHENWDKLGKERRKIEIAASKRRKQAW